MQDDLALRDQVRECLAQERRALVALDVEALAKVTLLKESLKLALGQLKASPLRDEVKREIALHNEFLRHSLKNLVRLDLQLKHLLGETPLYSPTK